MADYAAAHYGAQIVLTGGPTELEREYGEQIAANVFEPATNLIGKTTLKQLLALIERQRPHIVAIDLQRVEQIVGSRLHNCGAGDLELAAQACSLLQRREAWHPLLVVHHYFAIYYKLGEWRVGDGVGDFWKGGR